MMPPIDIGPHCSNPYSCDFKQHCWQHVPAYSIFNIARIGDKAWDLYNRGILNIEDVPADFPLNPSQLAQVDAEKNGEELTNTTSIRDFLSELSYPLYYLDFETFMSPVPLLDQTRPFDQIVFQYSLHVQNRVNGPCEHRDFLAEANGEDPRPAFIKKLIADCGTSGSIVVYNQGFEVARLNELALAFPQYADELQKIIHRIIDLMKPFQQKAYYTAAMLGKYSIKNVLPALVPDLAYDDLAIGDGGTASATFFALFEGRFEGNQEVVIQNLLDYCERDTWAMVVLMKKLYELSAIN
jgi:hypothetical protein